MARNHFGPGLKKRQRAFLSAFVAYGSIQAAAEAAGISRQSHYLWMKDGRYREAFEQAKEMAADRLVSEAYQRALNRKDRASAYLLTFLIKRLRPDFGVSRFEITQLPQNVSISDAELDAELSRLLNLLGYKKTSS